MKLVTFNPLRTIGIPDVTYIKPERMFADIETIRAADVLLFPEYWQVNSLVYGLKKKIFPSPESYHLGHDKVEMTRVLMTVCPEHVPYTEIAACTPENRERIPDEFAFPFVAKEVRNSMGRGVFLIENRKQWTEYAEKNDVLYVQEYIPSDRDLRVCWVGDRVIAAYWRIASGERFLHNVARGGQISFDHVPQDALKLVEKVAGWLNLNHAGFDILLGKDKMYILEFNVLFGNQGLLEHGIRAEAHIQEYLQKYFQPRFPTTPQTPLGGKRIS